MKTQREIETIKKNNEISEILINLFSKYKDYDSTLVEHYDSNTLFANRKKSSAKSSTDNTNVSIIEYKESLFKRLINKIKKFFIKNK